MSESSCEPEWMPEPEMDADYDMEVSRMVTCQIIRAKDIWWEIMYDELENARDDFFGDVKLSWFLDNMMDEGMESCMEVKIQGNEQGTAKQIIDIWISLFERILRDEDDDKIYKDLREILNIGIKKCTEEGLM